MQVICWCQWPRGLRRRSTAARLLRLWIQIPPAAWMFVCCVCCVLSGRGLCDELITRPEESYQLWRVVMCDKETSWYEEAIASAGMHSQREKLQGIYNYIVYLKQITFLGNVVLQRLCIYTFCYM
jgi:hypothetical protein